MIRLPLFLIALLSACYTYRPLETTTPVPGQRVSAQLTTEGSRDLTMQIGPEVLHVEGNVVDADSAGMDLDVLEIESYRGIRSDWHGERVRLPRVAVAGMQQRRLSIGGTGLLAGALTAGVYALYQVLGGSNSSTGSSGQGGSQGH
jgi:hypothetical protein